MISPSFTFRYEGTKHLKLVVTDTGCQSNGTSASGTASVDVVVHAPPSQQVCSQPVGSVLLHPVAVSSSASVRVSGDLVEGVVAPYKVRFEAKVDGNLSSNSGYTYNWVVDDIPMLNAMAGNTNTISKTFRDLGFHRVAVTVTDSCGNTAYDPIRIVPGEAPPAAQAECSDCKPEWQKFHMDIAAKQLTVASGDNLAVVVALLNNSKTVYYRLFDLQNRRFLANWKDISKLSQVVCDRATQATMDKPSVAVSKDGSKFIVAMEKQCSRGANNVFYEEFVRQSDGNYQEGDPKYMGQYGNKWSPVMMVNNNNNFAIAYLREDDNTWLHSNEVANEFHYWVKKAYIKFLKNDGRQINPRQVLGTWYRGAGRRPDFLEANANIVTQELEGRLKGIGFGDRYCMAFRRLLRRNFGTVVESDKNELVCRDEDGSWRETASFKLDTPSLASAQTRAGNMLIAVWPQSDKRLKIDTWVNLGNRKTYYTANSTFSENIGKITAVGSGILRIVFSSPSKDNISIAHPVITDSSSDTLRIEHSIDAGDRGVLDDAVYVAGANGKVIGVWLEGSLTYGITGSAE